MSADDSMFARQWKTGPFGALRDDLETGSGTIARLSDPRHTSGQR